MASNLISKARLINLATPDTNINDKQKTDPRLYRALKNSGDATNQLINSVFPSPPQSGYRGRIIIPGTPTVANDVLSHRYHVILPIDPSGYWTYNSITLTDCYITCMVQGTTASTSIDVKVSQQKGTTSWKSLFKPSSNPILPKNVTSTHDVKFAINTLYQDDLGRVDILAADNVISGLEIVLVGTYNATENQID